MSDVMKIQTVAFDGDQTEVVEEHVIPNDTRHTQLLTFENGPTEEPANDAVLINGRVIALGYFELDKTYDLLNSSDHPYLREQGLIHANDSIDGHITVEGLLVRGIWADDGHVIQGPTYVRLDVFGKEYAYDQHTDYATIDAVNIQIELPIGVPGHGGVQFKLWLQGELSRRKGTVNLEVVRCEAIGRWEGTELIRHPERWAADVESADLFEKWFREYQPIEGYRVKTTRTYSANFMAFLAQREAERQA